MKSINPATGKEYLSYKNLKPSMIEGRIEASTRAFEKWRQYPFEGRAFKMRELAGLLEERKEDIAALITGEMGKLIRESRSEVEKCAWVCRYYADHAQGFLEDEAISSDASKSFVTYQPLGVILGVMPWNFPFWQVFRYAVPTLMAGNSALLKHASNVPGCAVAIEQLFVDAGFPENTFQTLLINSEDVRTIIRNKHVKAVTLTGSEFAGSSVATIAGEQIKKTVMELGGNDPYLVLADAKIKDAVDACVTGRMINAGQSCIAAKRFIVDSAVYDDFVAAVEKKMKKYEPGDPMDEKTTLAPIARKDLRKQVHKQVKKSMSMGAKLRMGGKKHAGDGYFYKPTILLNVRPGMPAFEEEIFGPVASITKVRSEEEAIKMANMSKYGLGAAVFTSDVEKGIRIARNRLNAGSCFVNGFVRSDPRLPFGGVGLSGYGRELSSHGIREFVNAKTVWVQ